jgi:hypothetical protein
MSEKCQKDAGPGVRGAVIMGPASENLHITGLMHRNK